MKRWMKKTVAVAIAAVMGVAAAMTAPTLTAKADNSPYHYIVNRPGTVVHKGDKLSGLAVAFYVKQGKAEEAYEKWYELKDERDDTVFKRELSPYCIQEDTDQDYVMNKSNGNYLVREEVSGSDGYIVKLTLEIKGQPGIMYFLEPNMPASSTDSGETAGSQESGETTGNQETGYKAPAWLTDWQEKLEDMNKAVRDAKSGDTVNLDLGRYYNLSNQRMQMIADKNDVTYILNFTYQNVTYKVTIQPGTEIDRSCDWYGPLKLLSMFPYEIVE